MPAQDDAPLVICNRGPAGNPPGWLFRPRPSELAYLGWGQRRYGDAPIRPVLHEGWHYFFVLAGKPDLHLGGHLTPGRPGLVTLCHPTCSVGHTDVPGHRCEILVSIWRTPPRHSALQPERGGKLTFSLEPAALRHLKRIFALCRQAVASASERSVLELQAARLQIDLCLLDTLDRQHAADKDFRLDLAVDFLRNHLGDARPVAALCDYLQISGTSLKRLFLEQTGKSPREFISGMRMEFARQKLLSTQASVKEVSHKLGYRHATDFTRAFKQHFLQTPREMLQRKSA